MSLNSAKDLLDPSLVSGWIAKRQFIWQMPFLSSLDLCGFVRDRGLPYWCLDNDIQRLWQVGLLRADRVITKEPLTSDGFVLLEKNEEGEYVYSDSRECLDGSAGIGGICGELQPIPEDVYLMFHPFRYYVLYQIAQNLELNISKMQILRFPEGYPGLVQDHIQFFNTRTAGKAFRNNVYRWNNITSLAVAAEPFTFKNLFGIYSVPYPYSDHNRQDEFLRAVKSHFDDYKGALEASGIGILTDVVDELYREARMLEPNKDVLRILRFTKRRYRVERVKGQLGGAVCLLTMAEIVRRSAEMVFGTELLEEGEGDGFNSFFYGADRLNDNYRARGEFLRGLGLDHSVHLRWYVEGDTEWGALQNELAYDRTIELINLRGEVVAGKGKGLSFRENLLADINRSVYSWVSLDGDVEDNLRVLRAAAQKDEMFGMFFISTPDFEFANFTRAELVEILWQVALESGAKSDEKPALLQSTSTARSAKALFVMAKQGCPSLQKFDKGKSWGDRLMQLARNRHKLLQSDGSWKTRPIIEALYLARHTADCNYFRSRKECEVDRDTGRIVKKPKEKNQAL